MDYGIQHKRIEKELEELRKSEGVKIHHMSDSQDLVLALGGLKDTPFEHNLILYVYSQAYPYEPPFVTILNDVFHPNVSDNGVICLDLLQEAWTPNLTTLKILMEIQTLLSNPNMEDPFNIKAAEMLKSNKAGYDQRNKKARIVPERFRKAAMSTDLKAEVVQELIDKLK